MKNKIKNCSKCSYESMILQEFISADKQFLEARNEEYSDRLIDNITQQIKVMANECGINQENFNDIYPVMAKVRTHIDNKEFDKALNIVLNTEFHIRDILKKS